MMDRIIKFFLRKSVVLTAAATVIAVTAISCSDMYSDMLEGTKIRVGVLLANNTGIQAFIFNNGGFPENRNDLFPSLSDVFVKALSLDYDHDRDCDIALLSSSGYLRILLNDGEGHFSQLLYENTAITTPTDMATADFNYDGKPDFAIVSSAFSTVQIYTSPSITSSLAAGNLVQSVITGDINGDGLIDIYAGNNGGPSNNYYYINTSSGNISFGSYLTMAVLSSSTNDVSLTDVDNDNDNDLILSRGTFIDIYKNDGAGNFTFVENHSSVSFNAITAGDLNNDGYIDLFIGQTNGGAGSEIFINNRTGTFTNRHLTTDMNEAKLFDIDFDGDLDIIGKSSSLLVIMKNDGSGNFTLCSSTAVTTPTSITVFTYEED